MQPLRDLWSRIRWSGWFVALPEALQEPPGLYLLAGLAVVLVFGLLYGLGRLLARLFRGGPDAQYRQDLEREIRQLRRDGDFVAVGQRYETLDKPRLALAAYREGGCWEEYVSLLVRRGDRRRAKQAARDGEAWQLYGMLCHEDEEYLEAGEAFERAGKLYDAARSFEAGGEALRAARGYTAAGLEANAARLLLDKEGREVAETLDAALRSSLQQARGDAMSPEMATAVRRAAQLWVAEGQAERAYSLAVASEQWKLAAPVARDYLEATTERAEVCLRAGERLAAAEIFKKLGDRQQEALCRAEHHQEREEPAEAAEWFEKAEAWSLAAAEWAACGEDLRAAELLARAEEFGEAAKLYEAAGEPAKVRAMQAAAQARDPKTALEQHDETRQMRRQAPPAAAAEPASVPRAIGTPQTNDRYILQEEIGRGGMGVVYLAHDAVLKRQVAYKILSADVTGIVSEAAALLEEARAAARLSHPNIVQVYDAGQTQSGFFVVMELVEGENFAALLKRHRPSIEGTITVGRQVCSALEHAHSRRIIHRDLKPSNLIWTAEKQVKLADFGLARAFEDSVGKVMTRPAGTPYYMSPEQIRGAAVGPQADLYSLGCVLFELLCQKAPFVGGSSIYHHLNSPPEDPRQSREGIPPELAAIILQCLEKDPEKRPASAAEVGRRLAALGG